MPKCQVKVEHIFYQLQVVKNQCEDRVQVVKYFGLYCKGSVYVYIVYVYKHLTGGGIILYDVGGEQI